ncbi:MAG: hypothetical protein M0P64_00090 [Candidatus Pacebacteria bacterium]|jgi:hypothetical protein|nr:hypothetical protein [Candidatus Paceibacterota bacterium]
MTGNNDRLVVAAAIEGLISGQDSGDNAKIIIAAFDNLKPASNIISGTYTKKDKSGSTSGMTNAGQVSFDNDNEREKSFGIEISRIGKWKVWKSSFGSKSVISFKHFLSNGINTSERDREYFLQYDRKLNPVAFGYEGEPKFLVKLGPISFYAVRDVVVYGMTRSFPRLLLVM